MSKKEKMITPTTDANLVYKKRSQMPEVWRRFKKNKRAILGMIIVIFIVIIAILAPVLTKYEPNKQSLKETLQGPSKDHWFGTDDKGRDVMTRIFYGARVSLIVGVLAVLVSLVLGGTAGAISGYYGGLADDIIMSFMDILLAIPSMLLSISIVAALGNSIPNMMLAIGLSAMPSYCRTLRAEILSIRGQEFIEAAKAAGANDFWIIVKHVIPNSMAAIIVRATMSIGSGILSCSALSFIGLGVAAPTAEWGAMLNTGRTYLRTHSYLTTIPGIAIFLAIFAFNLMGDGLRDALDPKMKT